MAVLQSCVVCISTSLLYLYFVGRQIEPLSLHVDSFTHFLGLVV